MTEYFIRQKVLSFRSEFAICNRAGEQLYYACGEMLSLGHKIHLTNQQGQEIAYIKQQLMTWMPKYEIYIRDELVSTLSMKFSMRPKFYISPQDWQIEGDFTAHDYSFYQGDWKFAHVDKEWLTWGDTYHIQIEADNVAFLALCLMIATDLAVTRN